MSKSLTTYDAITNGKFLTVQFIKKDGSVRTVKARHGVRKYLKPGAVEKHDKEKYILVWTRLDGQKKYNTPQLIARNRILVIRAEGYEVKTNSRSRYAKLIQA